MKDTLLDGLAVLILVSAIALWFATNPRAAALWLSVFVGVVLVVWAVVHLSWRIDQWLS